MKNRLLSHPVLRIASLIIAFAVWLIIMNVSNPVITRTVSGVPVNVTNGSYIESMNLSYAIMSGFETVSVTVETNRSVVERLNVSNITANCDLTQIVNMESDPVMVPVTVSVPGVSAAGVTVTPQNIQIRLEEMESRDFVINAVAGSGTPARGFEVGSLTSNPEKLTIRGPKSMIERIDKVQAEVDVSNLRENTTVTGALHVYDRNGDELTESQMKSLTFSVNESAVFVDVTLYRILPDVGISAETYGEPAAGYQIGEVTVTPQTISVAGTDEALDDFREVGRRLFITEESHAVDVSGASSDVEIRVNLPDYLPAGLRIAEGFSDTVVVTVKILEYNTKSLEIETKAIDKQNLPTDMNAVFSSQVLDIRVKGTDSALSALTSDDVIASVDLSGAETGTVMVPVSITLPDGFELAEQVSAEITISETTVITQSEESDT